MNSSDHTTAVTARLVDMIRTGTHGQWVMPLHTHGAAGLFNTRNAITGIPYTGANTIALFLDALDQVLDAARSVITDDDITSWKLTAIEHYYIPSPPMGLAGTVIEPTDDLHRLQQRLIEALTPHTVETGTAAAFVSSAGGTDIQDER